MEGAYVVLVVFHENKYSRLNLFHGGFVLLSVGDGCVWVWKKLFFHYSDKIKTKTVGLGDKEETGIYQTNKAGIVCMH